MDLEVDKTGGIKYSFTLGPNRLAKGQSHRKMATQNHGSKAIYGQDSQVIAFQNL
jgi:hypothetical protein